MKLFKTKTIFAGVVIVSTLFATSGVASAHVTIKPAEVTTASFQTFTVSVPNEKAIDTTEIKVLVPASVGYVTPTQKTGWQVNTEKSGTGDEAKVSAITWTGGTIAEGLRDEFTFSAQVPAEATQIQWKAYQTYADGTLVSWDKSDEGGHDESANAGPFSITEVVNQVAQPSAVAAKSSDKALYLAIGSTVLSLVAIFLATRRNKS